VILFDDGHMPTAPQIARVDAYRQRWESFYADATSRRGSFDTTLAGTGNGTAECTPSGMVPIADAGVLATSDDAAFELDAHVIAVAPDARVASGSAGLPTAGLVVLALAVGRPRRRRLQVIGH